MKKLLFSLVVFTLILAGCSNPAGNDNTTDNQPTVPGDFPEIHKIDEILLNFYEKYQLPGGISLAISYNEKLVYSGSVGYADRQHNKELTPEYRMRIASLSKPITSIAIMKLMEENKLSLDERVFGEDGIFNNEYGMPIYNNNPIDITVKQLLEHSAGGWGNSRNDPMFMLHEYDGKELITRVLANYSLTNLPGTNYDYSNFGYYILGRVIEKKSNTTYESYVKEKILKLAGINGMRIGSNSYVADEAEYISFQEEGNPYSLRPVHMDSHGGWVANPVEILKLLVRVDGFSNVKDILDFQTIQTMITPSSVNRYYALGWSVNQNNNWWHTGSLPGTSAEMARSSNGFNWVILINYRPSTSTLEKFQSDMDQIFWKVFEAVEMWPIGADL